MDNKKIAQQIVTEYLKPIYKFALKRTSNLQDAEDLTQEIVLKLYKIFLAKDNIQNINAYVWRVAHNVLANFYRKKSRSSIGVCIDDFSELISCEDDNLEESYVKKEKFTRLQNEIAYLSKSHRKIIIMYYYECKKIDEIANLLNIPTGTVKWHLFDARKKLKIRMEKMNKLSELKFNPIKFSGTGLNGSVGSKGGTSDFLRSNFSQNIVYVVYKQAKTINEIAELLGVSPVYVESEVEYLEQYGFLLKQSGKKYIANILISDYDNNEIILKKRHQMYKKASKLLANEIFDKVNESQLINSKDIYYPDNDRNFLMWTLIFYVLANSDIREKNTISFEEAATIRKDGGHYIVYANIRSKVKENMLDDNRWCGPLWNSNEDILLWQINHKWCSRQPDMNRYAEQSIRKMRLIFNFLQNNIMSPYEYACLLENKFIKGKKGDYKLNIVWMKNNEIKNKFIKLGSDIKLQYKTILNEIKEDYIKEIMDNTPKHLKKMQAFGLQYLFKSDGLFLLYCAYELLETGRLKLVSEEQKRTISTLVITK